MSSKAIQIQRYSFLESDALLVDANIWLYIYGPQLNPRDDWKTDTYSKALKSILEAKSTVFVDVLILSEFINRYSRNEFELVKEKIGIELFKDFRRSQIFLPVAIAIADAVRRILKQSHRIGSGLESLDLDAFLTNYEKECPDFNDYILAELCRTNGLKLITHDGDFRKCNIIILTANKHLLA